MAETKRSPELAPEYALHRVVTTDDDPDAPPTNKALGMNMHSHEFANIQVIPHGETTNPAVSVLFWSEAAGKFINQNSALTKAGAGAAVPYEFSFSVYGRVIFVEVTGIAVNETCDVYVGGFGVKPQ